MLGDIFKIFRGTGGFTADGKHLITEKRRFLTLRQVHVAAILLNKKK